MSKWHGLVSMMNSLSAFVYKKITKIKHLQFDDSAILFLKVLIPRLTTLTELEIVFKKGKSLWSVISFYASLCTALYMSRIVRKPAFCIYAKTKMQISFAVTAKLISAFVFAS